jgi:hypothetical protein
MKRPAKNQYVMCIENQGYTASLDKRKVYEVCAPQPNDPQTMIRVIDESGEDYLFPAKWFVPLELPPKARRAIATVN